MIALTGAYKSRQSTKVHCIEWVPKNKEKALCIRRRLNPFDFLFTEGSKTPLSYVLCEGRSKSGSEILSSLIIFCYNVIA